MRILTRVTWKLQARATYIVAPIVGWIGSLASAHQLYYNYSSGKKGSPGHAVIWAPNLTKASQFRYVALQCLTQSGSQTLKLGKVLQVLSPSEYSLILVSLVFPFRRDEVQHDDLKAKAYFSLTPLLRTVVHGPAYRAKHLFRIFLEGRKSHHRFTSFTRKW